MSAPMMLRSSAAAPTAPKSGKMSISRGPLGAASGERNLGVASAGGAVFGEPVEGVDGGLTLPARVDLEVQVWAGGFTGRADIADVLTSGDAVAGLDGDAGVVHVRVVRGDVLAGDGVLEDDQPAIGAARAGEDDAAVGDGKDR